MTFTEFLHAHFDSLWWLIFWSVFVIAVWGSK